ncbi:cell envelope integrity protein TolA [Salmonella enterica]
MPVLKSLRFLPLCVLILSGYAFADSGNSSLDSDAAKRPTVRSVVDISSYVRVIFDLIKNQFDDSSMYKGKVCSIKLGLSRDGTVLYAVDDGGDTDLCTNAIEAIRRIKKFPSPPSDRIYQSFKDCTLDFRP